MNPAGNVRCNIMAIAKGYSCVSQPFFIARLALWDTVGPPGGVTPLGDVSSLTRSPGTSGAFFVCLLHRQAPNRGGKCGVCHLVMTRPNPVRSWQVPAAGSSPRRVGALTIGLIGHANWPGEVLQHRSRVWLHPA